MVPPFLRMEDKATLGRCGTRDAICFAQGEASRRCDKNANIDWWNSCYHVVAEPEYRLHHRSAPSLLVTFQRCPRSACSLLPQMRETLVLALALPNLQPDTPLATATLRLPSPPSARHCHPPPQARLSSFLGLSSPLLVRAAALTITLTSESSSALHASASSARAHPGHAPRAPPSPRSTPPQTPPSC